MASPGTGHPESRPLQRAHRVSKSLADAARQVRTAKRGSLVTAGGGRRARLSRSIPLILFVGSFLVPSLAGAAYYGLYAADQYVAEARFTVRNGEIPKIDALGALTGVQSITVVQDTQIVANYVQSRAMVEKLDRALDLRALYGSAAADWPARFNRDKPLERLADYWRAMTDVSIQLPSGIVTVTVRAFSANEAVALADAVLAESEALVNDMNERMRRDAVASAEADLQRASARLVAAREALEKGRNAEGLLDAGQAGQGLSELLLGLQGERLRLQQETETQLRYVTADAPQVRALQMRIDAIDAQIRQLKAGMTATAKPAGEGAPLSQVMTVLDQRALELSIAEKHYAAAIASLELARTLSEGKRVYLNAFVRPSLPEDARYPRRLLMTGAVVGGSFLAWAALAGIAGVVRNRLA